MVLQNPFGNIVSTTLCSSQWPCGTNHCSLVGRILNIWVPYQNQLEQDSRREELMQLLPNFLTHTTDERDGSMWECDHKRKFSIKNAYLRLNYGSLRWPFAKVIWKIKIPLKVRSFLWLIINRTLVTWDNLMKRSWQEPNICAMCAKDGESIDHFFFSMFLFLFDLGKVGISLENYYPTIFF